MTGDELIVVEGPDGAGKTTLVKHLSEKFDLKVGKRGVANRDMLYKVTRQDTYRALGMAVAGQERTIWDRLFFSEFVYAPVVNRPCEFSTAEQKFVLGVMQALACPVILCLPPFEVVKKNSQAVHQMKGVNEALGQIYMAYEEGDIPWPNHTIHYDYTGEIEHFASLEDVEDEVHGYLESRKVREAWD